MTTGVQHPSAGSIDAAPAAAARIAPYRFTVAQFLKMKRIGVLSDNPPVELLGGILVRKMVKKAPHNFAVASLADCLRGMTGDGWVISEEKSLGVGRLWLPEPDVAVLRGPWSTYRRRLPRVGDVGLIVEVSETSYATDRGSKWRRYAAVRLAHYWIVNIPLDQVETYSHPLGRGRSAGYREVRTYSRGEAIPVVLDGVVVGHIAVDQILG